MTKIVETQYFASLQGTNDEMKRIITILIIALMSLNLSGQTKGKMDRGADLSVSIRAQLDSVEMFASTQPEKAFGYVEKALAMSIQSGNKELEALSYKWLGKINYGMSQFDLASAYYRRATKIFENQSNNNEFFDCTFLLGESLLASGNYQESLRYLTDYENYIKNKKNPSGLILVKKRLAEVHEKLNNIDRAIALYNEVSALELQQGNQSGYVEVQNRLGNLYLSQQQGQRALETFKESERAAKSSRNKKDVASSLRQQSSAYRATGNVAKELSVRQEALTISEELADVLAQAAENLEIGNVYIEQQKADMAIPFIQKSINLAESTGDIEQKGKALKSLSSAYSAKSDYTRALEIYKEYVRTIDQLYQKREEEIKSGMQVAATLNRRLQRLDLIERELQLSEQTIDLLQQEQQVSKKELRAQKIFSIAIASIMLALVIGAFFLHRSSVQKRKANQMLALKSLRSQMNPHFIYNSLNSVNNFISKNDERSANKYLSDFSKLMRSVMENSKHDFVSLKSEIDILDVYLRLEHSRFSDKFDYEFRVDDELNTEQIQVPPMLIQPFIENAIWHGLRYLDTKGVLKVEITEESNLLKINIEDNGIGRAKSAELKTRYQKEHTSTGLRNIHGRIELLNKLFNLKISVHIDDLDIDNGTGTRVVIWLPLPM
jgi:tetratricopeptide (TPR) repeat protein